MPVSVSVVVFVACVTVPDGVWVGVEVVVAVSDELADEKKEESLKVLVLESVARTVEDRERESD